MKRTRQSKISPFKPEPPIPLPTSGPIFWLQADYSSDEILPPPGAVYKLACTTICLCRSEIITRWADREHRFVQVKFEGRRRALLAA